MDREKMKRQAKILKDKKLARIAKLSKQLRPQVKGGVVKYSAPIAKQIQKIQRFAAPPPPLTRAAQSVLPASQTQHQEQMKQQNINPKKIVHKQKGCSGCRRKIN